jgi:hypothetical protein
MLTAHSDGIGRGTTFRLVLPQAPLCKRRDPRPTK